MNSLKLMNLSKVTSLESGKAVHSLEGKYRAVYKEHLTHPRVRVSGKLPR